MPKLRTESDTNSTSVLLIPLRKETYAVELNQVVEVIPAPVVSILPAMPPALCGVTNFRGEIVPFFDTAILLGQEPCPEMAFGVVVNTPKGHACLSATAAPTAAAFLNGENNSSEGVASSTQVLSDGRLAVLLQVETMLSMVEP